MLTESTLLLFGLFMVAAASGWAFARYLDRTVRGGEPDPPPSQGYMRGLNLLLNQQTDQALDMFVRMVARDDEALDTHFALGSLFRRRGEVDRAIRIHQNILARDDLSDSQRDAALFELAEDYLKAGLLDRAEGLFRQVAESADDPEPALRSLIGIHETLSDWQRAYDAREELQAVTGESQHVELSHYLCELAERARSEGDRKGARDLLKRSRKGRRKVMRGALIRARLAEEDDDLATAWRLLERVVRTDTALLPEIFPALARVAEARNYSARLDRLLRGLADGDERVRLRIAYTGIVCNTLEPPVVAEAVEAFILGDSTLERLVDSDALRGGDAERRREAITRIAEGLRRLAQATPRYRCESCGYTTQQLAWQCPSCKAWDTSRPLTDFPYAALIARGGATPPGGASAA